MMTQTNLYAFFDKPTQQNLEVNQHGRLTPDQQVALKRGVRQQWWRVVLWVFVLFVLCALFGLFFWALGSETLGTSLLGPVLGTGGILAVGLLILAIFLFPDLSLVLAGGDIEAGQVEAVPGKVEWTGRRYQLVSEARSLRTVRGALSMPPPGTYRFYCLPNSGLVVQAEALGGDSAAQNKALLLDALTRVHRFTVADLDVNRQGSMSGGQALRLVTFIVGQGLLFLFAVGFGLFMYLNIPTDAEDMVWIALFGLLILFLALNSIWNILKSVLDMLGQRVAHEDGYVVRQEHRTRNGRYYTYQIKKLKFRVSRAAFHALVDTQQYRVYYSPRSKRLLGIEPLGHANPASSRPDDM